MCVTLLDLYQLSFSRNCTSDLILFLLWSLCCQSSTASFKEQCGLPTVAKLKQCIESLATRLQSPEGSLGAAMVLKEGYPCLEALVNLAEPTRKLLAAYNTVSTRNPADWGISGSYYIYEGVCVSTFNCLA